MVVSRLDRRQFLRAAAACAAASLTRPVSAPAQAAAHTLIADTRVIEVGGRAARVYGLLDRHGRPGLVLGAGERFLVDLANALDVPTLVHWHGQIPPNAQDGVPDLPMPALAPGEIRRYEFDAFPGTHWMHAHIVEHELRLLAAPLIVRTAADEAADRQEVVLFLHDFAFEPPEQVLRTVIGGASGAAHGAMGHGAGGRAAGPVDHGSAMGAHGGGMAGHETAGADLNDFNFDAYLANDRTLDDPEVVTVEAGGRILLRVINAAVATVFWIDTGEVDGRLVAVDGQPVHPVPGRQFGVAMGQRIDIEMELPREAGAYPVLALREGARERTGIILRTPGAPVRRLDGLAARSAPPFDFELDQERRLRASVPLAGRPPAHIVDVELGGSMQPYVWTIRGRRWPDPAPIRVQHAARVELTFRNVSAMAHPMHLHGHHFQVVAVNGHRFPGAVRDTVQVPPQASLTIAFDAGEPARWMLHCHHGFHLATGMMTELVVEA